MRVRDLLKTSLRGALAIFLAGIFLIATVAIYSAAKDSYDKREALPYESVREWKVDHKETLDLQITAKTKVISNKLLMSIEIDGYPSYLADRKNANAQLTFEFLDRDGFKVVSKPLAVSEFTTIVGKDGRKIGLGHQLDDYIDLESYKRFDQMQVGWNLDTKPEVASSDSRLQPEQPLLDHCAPKLPRAERLKRLAQFGTVREISNDAYEAGNHSVNFFYDGTLLNCQ